MKQIKKPNDIKIHYLDKFTVEHVYREIFVDNIYTKHGIEIKDGDLILDVGGNIGLFSLFADKQASNLEIYIFEPVPQIFEVLQANLRHPKNTIYALNVGLGDKEQNIEITYYPHNTGSSTIVPWELESKTRQFVDNYDETFRKEMPVTLLVPKFLRKWFVRFVLKKMFRAEKVQCKIRTLSSIIEEYGIKKVDFMKVDAENYELPIFSGILDEDWAKIRQIAVEVHSHIPGGEDLVERITTLLSSKGFRCEMGEESMDTIQGVYMMYAWRT